MKKQSPKEQNTKEKILTKAFALFAQKGIKDISMREIAQACGITKPVIYYYFKDKDDLCFDIVKHLMQMQEDNMKELAALPSFEDMLERSFYTYLHNANSKKIVPFMMHLHSYLSSRAQMIKKFRCLKHSQSNILVDAIKREVKEGRLPAATQDTVTHLIMAVSAHMVLNSGEQHIKFKTTFARDMAKAILRAGDYKGEVKK